jgi:hypothetical protein
MFVSLNNHGEELLRVVEELSEELSEEEEKFGLSWLN